jgi:hypothetical protein
MLLFCDQVMLSKGPERRISRESQNTLVNAHRAHLACVISPQISKHPGWKFVPRVEELST